MDAGTTIRQLPRGDARGRNLAGFSTPVNTEHVMFAGKMLWMYTIVIIYFKETVISSYKASLFIMGLIRDVI